MCHTSKDGSPDTIHSAITRPMPPAPAIPCAQNPAAILLESVDTTSGDRTVVVLRRTAQVVLQSLIWPVGITNEQKNAALAALERRGIVARMGV